MRFSVWPTPQQPWADVLATARHAAETGWDGVWFADHFISSLLHNERTTYAGQRYRLDDAPLEPKPGAMKLLVGGAGEKVTIRIAAQYADEWNTWGTPDILAHKNQVLDKHCAAVGRD